MSEQTQQSFVQPDRGGHQPSLIILFDADGNQTQLALENGDLIATALSGPNEGKTVNLTYGKWA